MVGSHIEAHLCGSMEDEDCGYDHTLIYDSSVQDGDRINYSVGEDNSNVCKDVVIKTKLMQLYVENDLREDAEL